MNLPREWPAGLTAGPQPEILLVDDDPAMVLAMARALGGMGRLRYASSGTMALRLAAEAAPDVVLLDADMPDMTGFEVCARLKRSEALAHVPVVFVTSHSEPHFEVGGFKAGAADYIAKPVQPTLLRARVQAHLRAKAAADEWRRLSSCDALTGVGNRRAFDAALQREWRLALRHGQPLALVLVDVDHFKAYNDHHGHAEGDACLRLVAGVLAGACQRPADQVFRYGGEEFAILLPQTERSGACHVVLQLLEAMRRLGLPHGASPTAAHVSVSAGVACLDPHPPGHTAAGAPPAGLPTATQLFATCDQALYRAKHGGRARACVLPAHGEQAPLAATVLVAELDPTERSDARPTH